MIALYNEISVEEIISRAKIQCRCANSTEYDSYFEIVIMEGLGALKILSKSVKKQCDITITDGTAELPKDFVRFLAFKATCNSDTLITYADTTFLESCGCGILGMQNWTDNVQINKGYIHFNNNTSLENGILAYIGLNVDKDGKALIYERYERALFNYACWQYTQMYFEKFNQYIIDGYHQQWVASASRLKGEDNANSFQNDKWEIGQMINTLRFNPNLDLLP